MMRIRIDGGPAHLRAAPRDRVGERDATAATSPTSPTGRTCSCTGSGSRTSRRSGSASRPPGSRPQEACGDTPRVILGCPLAGVAADEILDATPDDRRDPRALRRRPGVLEPAAQVQDLDQRLRRALHRSRDQRRLVRRRRAPGARSRLRPVGRRRALDEPDVRAAARRLRRARPRAPRSGPAVTGAVPRVRLPALAQPRAAQVPREGLGRRGVPRGAGEGVPRRAAPRRARAAARTDRTLRDHVGVHPQHDGRVYVGLRAAGRPDCAATSSGWSPTSPIGSAAGAIRTTTQQKLVIVDVERGARDELVARSTRWTCPRARARSARA